MEPSGRRSIPSSRRRRNASTWRLCPTRILRPEEIIATKAYIANRDRYDGADILHMIRALQGEVDWERLVELLEGDEEIVLWHLVLFAHVYPMHREWLPAELMRRAFERLLSPPAGLDDRVFRGVVLDPVAFRVDVSDWGYRDAGATPPLLDREGNLL